MENRWYLVIDGGEFIGPFIVYDACTREEVERYRNALLKPQGCRQEWGPGISIVDRSCWYAYWHTILDRYERARNIGIPQA